MFQAYLETQILRVNSLIRFGGTSNPLLHGHVEEAGAVPEHDLTVHFVSALQAVLVNYVQTASVLQCKVVGVVPDAGGLVVG